MKKTVLLLLSLLLGGCLDITIGAIPATVYSGQPTSVGITLKTGTSAWTSTAQVILTSNNPAVVFPQSATGPSNTATVTVSSATGTASQAANATAVTRNTDVNIHAVWRTAQLSDPTADAIITVLPPIQRTPMTNDGYVVIAPSISGSTTYVYEITAHNKNEGVQTIIGVQLQFAAPVTLAAEAITHATRSLIHPALNPGPNNYYFLDCSAEVDSVKVTATTTAAGVGLVDIKTAFSASAVIQLDMPGPQP